MLEWRMSGMIRRRVWNARHDDPAAHLASACREVPGVFHRTSTRTPPVRYGFLRVKRPSLSTVHVFPLSRETEKTCRMVSGDTF